MSREIDSIRNSANARIAREIMGWEDNWDRPGGSRYPQMWGIMDWYSPTEPARAANFPAFDDDIAAAWEVVEEMHRRIVQHNQDIDPWPHANYLVLSCRGLSFGWAAAFTCVDDDPEWYEHPEKYGGVTAATPAHAICNAALAALSPPPRPPQ
jgi:hypothetical protein